MGSSDDDGTIRSSGSTPRGKKQLTTTTIALCEVVPGDGMHIEPSKYSQLYIRVANQAKRLCMAVHDFA